MDPMRVFVVAVVATCGLFLSSAPAAMAADGKVTGTVTVGGTPLAAGKVTFHLDDEFVGSKIKDGKYTVNRVPVGTYHVTFEGSGVPAKFTSDDIKLLKVEVKEGINVFDFALQ